MDQTGFKAAAMSAIFSTSAAAAATQTVNTLAQQASTVPNAPRSLYAMATAITSFIFGERELPFNLRAYDPFLSTLFASAGSIALYRYFDRKRQSRARVHLAVFHIVKLCEQNEDARDLLHEPEELINLMAVEVMDLVERHISEQEGEWVMKVLRRKVEANAIDKERKTQRRRIEIEHGTHTIESSDEEEGEEEIPVEFESSLRDVSMVDVQNPTPPTSEEEPQPAEIQRITVTRSPHSLRVSSQERSAAISAVPARSGGFGLNYDDFSDSTSSGNDSPTDEVESPRIVKRASPYRSTAVRPRSPFRRTPPTANATRYAETGTNLSPIEEGNSVSPSQSQPRLYPRVIPAAVQQLSHQQEVFEDLGWEDPIVEYSPDTESYLDSSADAQAPVAPRTPIPSASRRSTAAAAGSSTRSPAVKRASPAVASSSAPKTPSPAKKKRGRPPKTPSQKRAPPVTLTRHSARKGTYKGSYRE